MQLSSQRAIQRSVLFQVSAYAALHVRHDDVAQHKVDSAGYDLFAQSDETGHHADHIPQQCFQPLLQSSDRADHARRE